MKKTILLTCMMLLASCDNNNIDTLSGAWETKTCLEAPAELGPHEGKYGRGIYTFTNNTINSSVQFYSGSACTEKADKIEFLGSDNGIVFIDLGSITLQEGIEGHNFNISFPLSETTTTYEANYTINNNELCFSNALDFNVYFLAFSEAGDDAIDFENCLIQQQP